MFTVQTRRQSEGECADSASCLHTSNWSRAEAIVFTNCVVKDNECTGLAPCFCMITWSFCRSFDLFLINRKESPHGHFFHMVAFADDHVIASWQGGLKRLWYNFNVMSFELAWRSGFQEFCLQTVQEIHYTQSEPCWASRLLPLRLHQIVAFNIPVMINRPQKGIHVCVDYDGGKLWNYLVWYVNWSTS